MTRWLALIILALIPSSLRAGEIRGPFKDNGHASYSAPSLLERVQRLNPIATASAAPQTQTRDPELGAPLEHIAFITADGFYPFTDRAAPEGGLITHLIGAAMDLIKAQPGRPFAYDVTWVDDWDTHLNPLLVSGAFDAGFPWAKPDCSSPSGSTAAANELCQRFLFSDSIYEVFLMLFVSTGSSMKALTERDMIGESICQPAGFPLYKSGEGALNWINGNEVKVVQPPSIEECFRLLNKGTVKGVLAPDLTGKFAVKALGMDALIKGLPKPVAISTLHVTVPKAHPQANAILRYTNWAIKRLHETGEYDRIVGLHLAGLWSGKQRR